MLPGSAEGVSLAGSSGIGSLPSLVCLSVQLLLTWRHRSEAPFVEAILLCDHRVATHRSRRVVLGRKHRADKHRNLLEGSEWLDGLHEPQRGQPGILDDHHLLAPPVDARSKRQEDGTSKFDVCIEPDCRTLVPREGDASILVSLRSIAA